QIAPATFISGRATNRHQNTREIPPGNFSHAPSSVANPDRARRNGGSNTALADRGQVVMGTGRQNPIATLNLLHSMSPLLAQSGHHGAEFQCLLLVVKRTSRGHALMSAFDPKRTFLSTVLTTSSVPV